MSTTGDRRRQSLLEITISSRSTSPGSAMGYNGAMKPSVFLILLLPGAVPLPSSAAPPWALEVDHLMIHVAPGAPERAALEHAGFTIAPDLNQHEGQGSASITVELSNGFLELAYRDTNVSVAPNLEMVARRF